MVRAWTLMTAMPPTKGHEHLMQFVSHLGDERSQIIVCTQPDEPFGRERFITVRNAAWHTNGLEVHHLNQQLPQDPNSEGFWLVWYKIMTKFGFKPGDIFVSSEPYGARLADVCDGVFMPYDIDRELYPSKATLIRQKPVENFDKIMPEFQKYLRTKVTIMGAESTGKTTLTKELAGLMSGHYLYEYARPYLTTVGPDITVESMTAIWKGQLAAEKHVDYWLDKPYVFQDTDLYSTLGYWNQSHWYDTLGSAPWGLLSNAKARESDLYLITQSNIPFEEDVIRYGGDHRESPDEYWIGVADTYGLNYRVLKGKTLAERTGEAMRYIKEASVEKTKAISYERQFNGSD